MDAGVGEHNPHQGGAAAAIKTIIAKSAYKRCASIPKIGLLTQDLGKSNMQRELTRFGAGIDNLPPHMPQWHTWQTWLPQSLLAWKPSPCNLHRTRSAVSVCMHAAVCM